MKLGLVSDVHAAPAPLAEAISIFHNEGVDRIICAGDIAGYNHELGETIDLLIDNHVECIIGNHDQSWLENHPELSDEREYRFLSSLPSSIEITHADTHVFIVHAQPPDGQHGGIKLLDKEGGLITQELDAWQQKLSGFDADILIVGHTHQVYVEQLGGTLVINPGSSVYNHSCMIVELPSRHIDIHALEGRDIHHVWNWGMQVRQQT